MAVAAALGLAACGGPDAGGGPVRIPDLRLVPDAQGIEVAGAGGGRIDFGRAEAGVLESVARVTGRRPEPLSCAAPGRRAWDAGDRLILVAEAAPADARDGGRFVGWRRGDAHAGLGCGFADVATG